MRTQLFFRSGVSHGSPRAGDAARSSAESAPAPDRAGDRERRDAEGKLLKRWTQTALAVSRVMQVWRSMVVRDRLLADYASVPFLQRQHFQLRDTGYARAAAASAGPKGVPPSVFEKVKEGRDNA